MPYSRDVDAYADTYFDIAAALRNTRELRLGPISLVEAVKMRHTWHAFVRAHRYTIERTNAALDKLSLGAKHPMTKQRIGPAQNELIMNQAREMRLDVIKKFECFLESANADTDVCYIVFKEKSERIPIDVRTQLKTILSTMPSTQREEHMLLDAAAPSATSSPTHIDDTMNALRSDPSTSFLFSMSIEEKIRTGIASREDFISCGLTPRAMYDMVLLVEDNEARNRMLGCLPPIEGIPINVLPPDSPFAGASAESAAQLDSAPPAPYAAQESKALALDEFLTTNGQSPEDFSNGNT